MSTLQFPLPDPPCLVAAAEYLDLAPPRAVIASLILRAVHSSGCHGGSDSGTRARVQFTLASRAMPTSAPVVGWGALHSRCVRQLHNSHRGRVFVICVGPSVSLQACDVNACCPALWWWFGTDCWSVAGTVAAGALPVVWLGIWPCCHPFVVVLEMDASARWS